MTSIRSVNSSALQILSQPTRADAADRTARNASDGLIAAANGAASSSSAGPNAASNSKLAKSFFDASTPSIMQIKVDLYTRTGKALGVKEEDFASTAAYGAALKHAVGVLRLQPKADEIIAGIEKDLGLDKLGVSLDTVIDAIIDPGSDADDKLTKALEKQYGLEDEPASAKTSRFGIRSDDLGIYRVA